MKPLFVFEMANNHMGDVSHGVRMIEEYGRVIRAYPNFRFAFKMQYRDLDTFIHKSVRGRSDIKYVKRFEETRLSDAQFRELVSAMKSNGFEVVCTPFDERSVDRIEEHGIETIKVASCSLGDWPLMERMAQAKKPIIASTAGSPTETIDHVVSFFVHREKNLTVMHCVAEYPTPHDKLQLNQIDFLRRRYPEVTVGYSTHEFPNNYEAIQIAIAKGAMVFEKHVALATDSYAVNAYSATPDQVRMWLDAATRAFAIAGADGTQRYAPSHEELASLHSLRRGVFANKNLAAGTKLSSENVEFAFPPVEGQLTANEWSKYASFFNKEKLVDGEPILRQHLETSSARAEVIHAVERVSALLDDARVVVPGMADLEVSHHYGMEKFRDYGLTMITVVNRAYCKKILVLLPGQTHPEQYHEQKEETFVVVYGSMTLWLDGMEQHTKAGDVITVTRGVRHKFFSKEGVVFEEISSTHIANDSFYTDPEIGKNRARKTLLSHWLRRKPS